MIISLPFSSISLTQLQELLFQSLCEMELIHRQEELEHLEIEKALNLSLQLEEERLNSMLLMQSEGRKAAGGATAASAKDNKVSE
jgi:hypothetical protein